MQDDSAGNDVSRMMAEKKWSSGRSFFLALMISTGTLAVPTLADQAFAQAAPRAAKTSFNIRPQPLAQALVQFSNATGVQLFFNADLARGINSQGAQGSLTRTEALSRILSGSGLTYKFTNASTVTIQKPGAASSAAATEPGAIALDTINVQGGDQSPTGPGVGYIGTRSVSGTKTDLPLVETPQSISVVTRKQMDDQGVQSVSQAMRYTPGVLAEGTGIYNRTDNVFGRGGFQPDEYLNGLRLNQNYTSIDPWSLERIEYARGPSSILYGQVSPAGVINLASKMPTPDPLHVVQLQLGSHNRLQTAFDFGGPLNQNGTLLYRVDGLFRRADSQVQFNKEERVFINPSISWRPDADTNLTIYGGYQHDPHDGTLQQLPNKGTVLANPFGKISRSLFVGDPNFNKEESTNANLGYSFEHRFNENVKIYSDLRYVHTDMNTLFLYPDALEPDMRTLDRYAQIVKSQSDTVTADNRVQFNFDTGPVSHTAIAGIDYQMLSLRSQEGYNFDGIPSLDVFNPVYGVSVAVPAFGSDFRQTQNQLGLYAQDILKIDRLRLIGGIRQDWATSRSHDELDPGSKTKQDDSAFTYRLGALYLFDNGFAPYVSYSTSFQPQSGSDFFKKPFVPTTGNQAEIGFKYQPTGFDSFITLAAYDLKRQNVVTLDPNPLHANSLVQTGEVRARGVEFEAHAQLTNEFGLIGSYAYQDVEVTKDNMGLQGKTPVRVPNQTASFWGNYTFDGGALAGLAIGGGVRYVGQQWGDAKNTYKVPDFTLFDAAISYDFGKALESLKGMNLAVNVSNIFDKKYVATCIYSDGGCYYGPGRTVYATLTYKW